MNYYKELRLDELGISSDEEAEELEFELELRFEEFTPKDRKTWLQQNAYLDHLARTGTVTSAARRAGVTVYNVQTWKYSNILGFNRRLEVATLEFNDRLQEKALLRASDPKAPATLLIALLRAYIPDKFSANGHKCDTSRSDEILRRFRENAQREKEAGHPRLRALAQGATNAYPPNDHEPADSSLSPAGGETQRGGSAHSHQPSSHTRHTGEGRYPETPPLTSYRPDQEHHTPPASSAVSPSNPASPNLSRAERREQLRQQRKAEKKNTFPVKRF